MEPNSRCGINSVTTGKLFQDELPNASEYTRTEQHENMTTDSGMLRGVQDVSAFSAPHQTLYDLQQPGKRCRGYTRPNASEHHRQPKRGCAGTNKCGGYILSRSGTGGF